jgi:hypothetical protein
MATCFGPSFDHLQAKVLHRYNPTVHNTHWLDLLPNNFGQKMHKRTTETCRHNKIPIIIQYCCVLDTTHYLCYSKVDCHKQYDITAYKMHMSVWKYYSFHTHTHTHHTHTHTHHTHTHTQTHTHTPTRARVCVNITFIMIFTPAQRLLLLPISFPPPPPPPPPQSSWFDLLNLSIFEPIVNNRVYNLCKVKFSSVACP